MSLERLASKYIASAERVFSEIRITEDSLNLDINRVEKVVEFAKAYLHDAKYYKDKKKIEVSLASVAYCEGLLDALKLLGLVKFEWPTKRKAKSEK